MQLHLQMLLQVVSTDKYQMVSEMVEAGKSHLPRVRLIDILLQLDATDITSSITF